VISHFDTNSGENNATNRHKTVSIMDKLKAKTNKLSIEETREILTPTAFKIDQSLFGISLAKPWRRGMALLVDLMFVAILSFAPGELLALLVAITLFNIGGKKRANKRTRVASLRKTSLRLVGAFIVFIVLIETLPKLFTQLDTFNNQIEQVGQGQDTLSNKKNNEQNNNDFIKGTVTLAASLAISNSDCEQYSCWQQLSRHLFEAYAQQTSSTVEIEQFNANLLEGISDESSLTAEEIAQLTVQLKQLHLATQTEQVIDKNTAFVSPEIVNPVAQPSLEILVDEGTLQAPSSLELANGESTNMSVYKGFAWLQGLIQDLGLGFGWAAFYFTMFTALWYGQTLGKKLFSIRVIQLDGTPLSIWDSFGRYGGYGAGIATGLLGFAQIYWDPNRQAIHDKISATIVINDNDTDRKNSPMKNDE